MLSLFVENLALTLIARYQSDAITNLIISLLNPLYLWAVNHGL